LSSDSIQAPPLLEPIAPSIGVKAYRKMLNNIYESIV